MNALTKLDNGCFFAMPVSDVDSYITTLVWQLEERDKLIRELRTTLLRYTLAFSYLTKDNGDRIPNAEDQPGS